MHFRQVSCVYLENIYYTFSLVNNKPNYHYFLSDYIGLDDNHNKQYLIQELENNIYDDIYYDHDESKYYVLSTTMKCIRNDCDRNIRITTANNFSGIVNRTIYTSETATYLNGLKYYDSSWVNDYGNEEKIIKKYYYEYGNLALELSSYIKGTINETIEKNYYYSEDYETLQSVEDDTFIDSYNSHVTERYYYNNDLSLTYSVIKGLRRHYNYDIYNRLISIDFVDENFNVISTNYIDYNKKDLISSIKTNNNTYGFLYSALNDVCSISINSNTNTRVKKHILNNTEEVIKQVYNNNLTVNKTTYDIYGDVIEDRIDNTIVNFNYENNNLSKTLKRVVSYNDPYINKSVSYTYDDSLGQTVKTINNYITTVETEKEKKYHIYSENYEYKRKIESIGIGYKIANYYDDFIFDDLSYTYIFDYFNRLKNVINSFYDSYTIINLVKNLNYSNKMLIPNEVNYSVSFDVNDSYYEANIVYSNEYNGENITRVSESGTRFDVIPNEENTITISNLVNKTYTYTYDSFNRLISESFNNNIINYEYGPISQMIEKVYNNNVLTKEFNYSNGKLISFKNGNITSNISYDKIGNIISIGATNYTYSDRGLLSSVSNNTSVNFSYNYEGIRVSKETSEKLVKYYTDGHNIIGEDWIINNITARKIKYFYNSEGICGIRYNGKNYHLIKDSLGNISKVMYHGLILGEYNYDAWGNVSIYKYNGISIDDSFIIDNNPFRYKGYYYDTETNLYYLINRYYSPDIYIFISPDSVNYLDIYRINGLNQYCYCYNNPVMYIDEDGNFPVLVGALIGGAIIGFVTTYIPDVINDIKEDGFQWSDFRQFKENGTIYLINAAAGALTGLIGELGIPVIFSAPLCGLVNVTSGLLTGDIDKEQLGQAFAVYSFISLFTLGIGKFERNTKILKGFGGGITKLDKFVNAFVDIFEKGLKYYGKSVELQVALTIGLINGVKKW